MHDSNLRYPCDDAVGILLFPAFAALVYFTYSVGKTSADDGGDDTLYQKAA